jgi:hypothetical protein
MIFAIEYNLPCFTIGKLVAEAELMAQIAKETVS